MDVPQDHSRALAARGAAWLAKQVERALADVDLTTPQYRLLSLVETEGATATYAAERLAVSPPSVTAIVDGLVQREFVTREAVKDDRRRVELRITEAGAATLHHADAVIASYLEEVASFGNTDHAQTGPMESLAWWLSAIHTKLASPS